MSWIQSQHGMSFTAFFGSVITMINDTFDAMWLCIYTDIFRVFLTCIAIAVVFGLLTYIFRKSKKL